MGTPYLSEIKLISWNYSPKGWAFCNGQFMPINQNQALFSLLGTTFGGNGQTTFALPDFRGRVPMHVGGGHALGEAAGSASVTLSLSQMPAHNHIMQARNATAGVVNGHIGAATKTLAQGLAIVTGGNQPVNIYGTGSPTDAMGPTSTTNVGGSQAHENRQPFLTLNYIIALIGVFPSRN